MSNTPVQIQILRVGCSTCRRMEWEANEIVRRLKLDAQVSRVEDIERILQLQLTGLPGLVIDEQLVACGYTGKDNLERLLKKFVPGSIETSPEQQGG